MTRLYSFCAQAGCSDGLNPAAALLQATSGTFYGTTEFGGIGTGCDGGCGTVFSLDLGFGPFVSFVRGSGRVGAKMGILGTNLTGATSVTFNGIPAQFSVPLPTLILAYVPEGATTGRVQVTLPDQTLSSNVPFYVLK